MITILYAMQFKPVIASDGTVYIRSDARRRASSWRVSSRTCSGVSAGAMIRALIAGEGAPAEMAIWPSGTCAIAACDAQIATLTAPHAEALARLDTIPGVARRTAEVIAAELGCDMTRFPTADQAASWTGLCTGNRESAGKRLSGRPRHAENHLFNGTCP